MYLKTALCGRLDLNEEFFALGF